MPLAKCSVCHLRSGDKLISTYFAWFRADGVRKAYKGRLCHPCFAEHLVPLDQDYAAVERLTCPGCGIDTEDDYDVVYYSAFIPHYGLRRVEIPYCGACAAHRRIWIENSAEPIEGSLGATGSPQTEVSGDDVLRSLGIEPRSAR